MVIPGFRKKDKYILTIMPANTHAADINEILLGYYLAEMKWSKYMHASQVQAQLRVKQVKVPPEDFSEQSEKAKVMATEVRSWAKKNGYTDKIDKVYWTARPGVLSKAVGQEIDSRRNPTDVLVEFQGGTFLGVSAKSTKTRGDISFKNPGVGTVEKDLNINLSTPVDRAKKWAVNTFGLNPTGLTMKREIRSNPKVQIQTREKGAEVIKKLRDITFRKLNTLSQKERKNYILKSWMDAGCCVYPPFIKATGMGIKPLYTAKIEDVLRNSRIDALNKERIVFRKMGESTIGVKAGQKKIFKLRFKWQSEPIASTVQLSGDPW